METQQTLTQANQTQDVMIRIIREEFKELKASNTLEHKDIIDSTCTKRDLDRIIESNNRRIEMLSGVDKDARKDLDDHCLRVRELEKNQALITESIKPTQDFVKDLQGRILTGFFALLAILGAIIYAAVKYLDKK